MDEVGSNEELLSQVARGTAVWPRQGRLEVGSVVAEALELA